MDQAEVLTSVAAEIGQAHEAASRALGTALSEARRAGDLLLSVKAQLAHGAWLAWLGTAVPTLPVRTAQVYMRVARRWPELEANAQPVAHLSLREAVGMLTVPRTEEGAGDEVDWAMRVDANVEALAALASRLKELAARIPAATTLAEAAANYHESSALEGRVMDLRSSIERDLVAAGLGAMITSET